VDSNLETILSTDCADFHRFVRYHFSDFLSKNLRLSEESADLNLEIFLSTDCADFHRFLCYHLSEFLSE
jgi:hypothetical protein